MRCWILILVVGFIALDAFLQCNNVWPVATFLTIVAKEPQIKSRSVAGHASDYSSMTLSLHGTIGCPLKVLVPICIGMR